MSLNGKGIEEKSRNLRPAKTQEATSGLKRTDASASVAARFRQSTAALRSSRVSSIGFAFLIAFFVVYCSRPEEWIFFLRPIPVAKITAGGAIVALWSGNARLRLKDLPREAHYLLAMIIVLLFSAVLSPIWRGGAVLEWIVFSKIFVVYVLIYMLVTDMKKLRQVIFVQAASMVVVTTLSILKGSSRPRLEGVIGGVFSNPNDLAFAIVLSLPFCLAFLVTAKNLLVKCAWIAGMLVMLSALFLTASRAGFIDLLISGAVCLWHFGIRGRRYSLIAVTLVLSTLLLATAGKKLVTRFEAISEGTKGDSAYGSYEARRELMVKALQGLEHYPLLGMGPGNFVSYSGSWHEVHMTYLQIAVEGGIPSLILYLLIFGGGFRNLRELGKRKDLLVEDEVFRGAMHSSFVGFVVGALFSPEAYHFFPYFAVAYTSVMVAMFRRKDGGLAPEPASDWRQRRMISMDGAHEKRQPRLTVPR
jgi:O-antigen ligase